MEWPVTPGSGEIDCDFDLDSFERGLLSVRRTSKVSFDVYAHGSMSRRFSHAAQTFPFPLFFKDVNLYTDTRRHAHATSRRRPPRTAMSWPWSIWAFSMRWCAWSRRSTAALRMRFPTPSTANTEVCMCVWGVCIYIYVYAWLVHV